MSHNYSDATFVDIEIEGVKPSINGWMWIHEANPFDHFVNEITHYMGVYRKNCKQFKVAVQAGGHMGVFPRMLSELFETVYTFEPDSVSFHCLTNNCQKKNIIKFNTALGNGGPMMYQSHYYYGNVGMNNYKPVNPDVEPTIEYFDREYKKESVIANIPQIRLDDLNLSNCDLIHLDMEGNEHYAFDGMVKTIEKFKPFILYESGPNATVMNFMLSLGYEPVHYPGDAEWICKG